MKHNQELINQLKQELHTRLLWEVFQMEYESFKTGSSIAVSEYDCFSTTMEWKVEPYTAILDYYGYEFDRFDKIVKQLHDLIESLKNEQKEVDKQ